MAEQTTSVRSIYLSHLFDRLTQMIVDRKEPRPYRFHHELLASLGCLDDLSRFAFVHRQWLLAQDVFVVRERLQTQISMDLLDRSDVNNVHVRILQHFFLRAVRSHAVTQTELTNELVRLLLASRTHSDDRMFSSLTRKQCLTEILTNPARAHNTPS